MKIKTDCYIVPFFIYKSRMARILSESIEKLDKEMSSDWKTFPQWLSRRRAQPQPTIVFTVQCTHVNTMFTTAKTSLSHWELFAVLNISTAVPLQWSKAAIDDILLLWEAKVCSCVLYFLVAALIILQNHFCFLTHHLELKPIYVVAGCLVSLTYLIPRAVLLYVDEFPSSLSWSQLDPKF